MSATSTIYASRSRFVDDTLADAQGELRIRLCAVAPEFADAAFFASQDAEARFDDWISQQSPFDLLILAPLADCGHGGNCSTSAIGDILGQYFAYSKAAVRHFTSHGKSGRILSLLPGDAAMGDPNSVFNSAVAGGMLSLFRTLALELRKTPVTANTVMYDATDSVSGVMSRASLVELIRSFGAPGCTAINGQELYALCGADVGRIHP